MSQNQSNDQVQNNQDQGNASQQQDDKIIARHTIFRDTRTNGSLVTMFIAPEDAEKLLADLTQAVEMTKKNEAEGAMISVVTGEGRNGKPYSLVGIRPTYPGKNQNSGQGQNQTQNNSSGYRPRGGYNNNRNGGNYSRGNGGRRNYGNRNLG